MSKPDYLKKIPIILGSIFQYPGCAAWDSTVFAIDFFQGKMGIFFRVAQVFP